MGYVPIEQTTAIIRETADAISKVRISEPLPKVSMWIPVILACVTGVFGLLSVWLKMKLTKERSKNKEVNNA